jgi:hypothetical protein
VMIINIDINIELDINLIICSQYITDKLLYNLINIAEVSYNPRYVAKYKQNRL